jgi:hypothetical protein
MAEEVVGEVLEGEERGRGDEGREASTKSGFRTDVTVKTQI